MISASGIRPAPTSARTAPRLWQLLTAVVVAVAALTAVAALHAPPARALDDGQALTPPMGWNNWNAFHCNVNAAIIRAQADALVRTGLADAGYDYVNIDDCWMEKSRDKAGHLVADPAKFPHGISGISAYVHSKGLKLGIYEDAGRQTCAGYPGSLYHEETDAADFARWGVDLLKYDNCHNGSDGSLSDYQNRYQWMHKWLSRQNRKILYSICEWGVNEPWTWAGSKGHMWRTTEDIYNSWYSTKKIIAENAPLASYAGPGHWNDPDMLEVGNSATSPATSHQGFREYKTQFSMWSEMAAPLIIGTDLTRASRATMRILGNTDVIAVDQDPLGVQGRVVKVPANPRGTSTMSKMLADGARAIAFYNPTNARRGMRLGAARIFRKSAKSYAVRNLWTHRATVITSGIFGASVAAHGTVMFRVSPRW